MPQVEEIQLHPWGWENDPQEERFKLSTFDFLSTITYTNMAVFFKIEDSQKMSVPSSCSREQSIWTDCLYRKAAAILKEGAARTLSQIRHLVGTIERDEDGHHSIIRKKDSTVRFVTQHLDYPGDTYPSFEEIERADFTSCSLGDINVISNSSMTCGNRPEAHPDNSPAIVSFKVNFIPGGIILNLHTHHWANGLKGATAYRRQLAENCYAVAHGTEFPSFDPKWLHRELYGLPGFERPAASNEGEIEAPHRAHRDSQHKPSSSLMFHLRKSKAVELKKAVSPSDGTQISTYNAICALMWRVLSRIREPLYKTGLDYKPLWAEGVSFGKLFKDPPLPRQLQGNLQFDISSWTSPVPQLTLAEIISEAPLSKLAIYTRQITDSVTVDMLFDRLKKFSRIKNKHDLSIHVDSYPPMSLLVSDWRPSDLCTLDFGFAEPTAWRHLFGGPPLSQAVIYPPHKGPAGDDEGFEIQFTLETELVPQVLSDLDWSRYFEFRGVDASDEGITT
ncbi:hypothetical protein BDV96DRAFT_592413 [Lophiotrema nucula]|uniref:Trichothecene 3-O-acetyltransferase-like N-terminal domain-containing protein n=1 Tax=Lophiotrema nucula TaxID=690887 RepID=A0A6A5YEL0_9PLEO|nr:hypothetical protein BDV96DRAFT_592413 [Lophiotrema nucula]